MRILRRTSSSRVKCRLKGSFLLTFNRVKAIIGRAHKFPAKVLIDVCTASELLDVDHDSLAVRRKESLLPMVIAETHATGAEGTAGTAITSVAANSAQLEAGAAMASVAEVTPEAVSDPTKLREQIEYYFSDVNLANDEFLKSNMNPEGFVSASVLLTFNRVKTLMGKVSEDPRVILADACVASPVLDADHVGLAVRRKEPFSTATQSEIGALTVSVHPIPVRVTVEELIAFFNEVGLVRAVSRRLATHALVVFDSAESCDKLVAAPPTYAGERLHVVKKTDLTKPEQPQPLRRVEQAAITTSSIVPLKPSLSEQPTILDTASSSATETCSICNCDVPSGDMARHLRGKRHIAKASDMEIRACIRATPMCSDAEPGEGKLHGIVLGEGLSTCPRGHAGGNLVTHKNSPANRAREQDHMEDDALSTATRCSTCDCNVPVGGMGLHLRGKRHKARASDLAQRDRNRAIFAEPGVGNPPDTYQKESSILIAGGRCPACQCYVGRKREQAHVRTQKHKDAVSAQNIDDDTLMAMSTRNPTDTYCSFCKCSVAGNMKIHLRKDKHIESMLQFFMNRIQKHFWIDGHHTARALLDFPPDVRVDALARVNESPGLKSCANSKCAGPNDCGEVHFAKINAGGMKTDVRTLHHTRHFLSVVLGPYRSNFHRVCRTKHCCDTGCKAIHRSAVAERVKWSTIADQRLSLPGLTSLSEVAALHPQVRSRQLPPLVEGPRDDHTQHGFLLRRTAKLGDFDETQKLLLREGRDIIDSGDSNGWTALHVAALHDQERVVNVLLRHGASVTAVTNDGLTALHAASSVKNRTFKVGEKLIRAGALVSAATHSGWAPMHFIAYAAQFRHHAKKRDTIDPVKCLVENGASVDDAARDGSTALHLAATYGVVAMLRTLVEAKADVNATTATGMSPLLSAAAGGHVDFLEELSSHLPGSTVIGSVTDHRGATALHVAAENGNVEPLFPLGLDAQTVDYSGSTVLHYAARNGHASTVQALVELEASLLQVENKGGETALECACAAHPSTVGSAATARFLVDCVCAAEELNGNGDLGPVGVRALHAAVAVGNGAAVFILLAAGKVPPDSLDPDGRTALHKATRGGSKEAVRQLLLHGASHSWLNSEGQCALDVARASEDVELNGVFLDCRVDEAPAAVFAAGCAKVRRMVDLDAIRRRLDQSHEDLGYALLCGLGATDDGRTRLQEARGIALDAAKVVLEIPHDALPMNDELFAAVRAFEEGTRAHVPLDDDARETDEKPRYLTIPHQRAEAIVRAAQLFVRPSFNAELEIARLKVKDLFDAHARWAGREGLERAARIVAANPTVERELEQVERHFPGYAAVRFAAHHVAEFREAVRHGMSDLVAQSLDEDPALATLPDADGVPPLHHAVRKGNVGMIELLLSRGANPMQKDGQGAVAEDAIQDALLFRVFLAHRKRVDSSLQARALHRLDAGRGATDTGSRNAPRANRTARVEPQPLDATSVPGNADAHSSDRVQPSVSSNAATRQSTSVSGTTPSANGNPSANGTTPSAATTWRSYDRDMAAFANPSVQPSVSSNAATTRQSASASGTTPSATTWGSYDLAMGNFIAGGRRVERRSDQGSATNTVSTERTHDTVPLALPPAQWSPHDP